MASSPAFSLWKADQCGGLVTFALSRTPLAPCDVLRQDPHPQASDQEMGGSGRRERPAPSEKLLPSDDEIASFGLWQVIRSAARPIRADIGNRKMSGARQHDQPQFRTGRWHQAQQVLLLAQWVLLVELPHHHHRGDHDVWHSTTCWCLAARRKGEHRRETMISSGDLQCT